MIKRLRTVKNIGCFTELHSERGDDGNFAKLNIVYALNASGKSTLCDVLRSMATNAPAYLEGRKRLGAARDPEIVIDLEVQDSSQAVRFQGGAWHNAEQIPIIHIFDERFVADNILLGHHIAIDHRRNLYGFVIGAQGIALKQALDTAADELAAATDRLNEARRRLENLLPPGLTIEGFRDLPATSKDQIEAFQEALEKATQTNSKADAIRRRPSLSPVPVPIIPVDLDAALAATLDTAALVAEQKIREHLDAHSHGLSIDWIKQGYRAQTGTTCPHCGQDMENLDILSAYRACFSGALEDQEQRRNAVKSAVEHSFGPSAQGRIRTAFAANENERAWWQDAAGLAFDLPTVPPQASVEEGVIAAYEAMIGALARKQANPASPAHLTEPEQQALDAWQRIAEDLSRCNDTLAAVNDRLDREKASAGTIDLGPMRKQSEILQNCGKRYQQDVIDAYAEYDDAQADKPKKEKNKRDANDSLRGQANQILSEYGSRINELLNRFGVDLEVVSEGVSFQGGPPSGQIAIKLMGQQISCKPEDAGNPSRQSLANTLSGGDRSALALAFFLATVEQSPDLDDSIVVFDDPFHSQDRSRQRRTVECVRRVAKHARQCFLFSHDLEFARAVDDMNQVGIRTFVLEPMTPNAILIAKPLPMLPSRAYEEKYSVLTKYIADPASFSGSLNLIAGTLRTVLEEYLQLKFPLRWAEGRDWLGTMIGKIRESRSDDPLFKCKALVEDLGEVNDYSQRFHHRTTGATADIPDARELKTYAEQTLSIIHK